MWKKAAAVTAIAFAASGLMATSALASPVHAAGPTGSIMFSGGSLQDNRARCVAYGAAAVTAGKFNWYTCVNQPNNAVILNYWT